jgi:nucleoside permease NupC
VGLMHFELIQPFAFVMGVPLVQVVITAKVVGRMMTQNRTSIREAYVEKGKPNAVSLQRKSRFFLSLFLTAALV